MSTTCSPVRTSILAALRPDPALTVTEWAEKHRMLSGRHAAEPGQFRMSRTPYMREIADALSVSNREVQFVVVQAGAQVGKTTIGENWLGYVIDHAPAPFLFVEPTVDLAKKLSKQRIQPMISSTASLSSRVQPARARDSGNTILEKEFPGGSLVITGANSAVGLRQMSARNLFFDEVDGYPADVEGEGDPIELALRRTATYRHTKKILLTSTPTTAGTSRIEAAMARTDRRRFYVECPDCQFVAPIEWRNIVWDKEHEDDPETPTIHHPETARLHCEACGTDIEERWKAKLLAGGDWVATAKGEPGMRGYLISSLYSPPGWYSWSEAVSDFLEAKRFGTEKLKTWTNTVLGETWEEQGETLEPAVLLQRRETYGAIVPEKVVVLTAGVDVQANRIEMEVVGWGHGEESWGIDYRVLLGDTDQPEVWDKLTEALGATYPWGDTETRLRISTIAIDASYRTQMVYAYVRTGPPNAFAVMGFAGAGRPIVAHLSKRESGATRAKVRLYSVGVDGAKDLLYARLRKTDPGPGTCHFPSDRPYYSAEYFAQLTGEKKVTRYHRGFAKHEWIKIRPRNEALDVRVYAMAALYVLNPVYEAFEAALREASNPQARRDQAPARDDDDWIDGWRR